MDILKLIESLPDNVKNIIVATLLNTAMATKSVEDDLRTVQPIPTNIGLEQHKYRRQSPAQLLQSMKRGEFNEQYVNYYYEVLKKVDALMNNATPQELQLLAEKYGMGDAATSRYKFLNNHQQQVYGNRTPQQVRNDEYSRRVTSDDNFPIEKMVTNRRHLQNALDHSIGAKPIYSYSLRIQRMFQTEYNIEQITEYLHVKELVSEPNGRILEFYIPKNVGLKQLRGALFEEMKSINMVSFQDEYGQPFDYRVHSFYKLGEKGMHDVMKFKANRIQNMGFM